MLDDADREGRGKMAGLSSKSAEEDAQIAIQAAGAGRAQELSHS